MFPLTYLNSKDIRVKKTLCKHFLFLLELPGHELVQIFHIQIIIEK